MKIGCKSPLALLAVWLACGGQSTPASRFEELGTASVQAERAQDFSRALVATKQMLELLPGTPRLLAQAARQAALAGDADSLVAALEELVRLGGGVNATAGAYATALATHPRKDVARAATTNAAAFGEAKIAFELSTPDTVVEGMALDPRDGSVLLADMLNRRIVRRARDGTESTAALPQGISGALGLKADGQRRHLWQCAARGTGAEARAVLLLLDLDTFTLRREIAFPTTERHLCNDVDVLPDGRVVVTDSEGGRLWLASVAGELKPLTPSGGMIYPNGVAVGRNGRGAFVATSAGLRLVDLSSGSQRVLVSRDGGSLSGFDGLYRRGDSLIGIQNGMVPVRVAKIELDDTGHPVAVEPLVRASPHFDLPTTGAIRGDTLLLVANAQFRKLEGGRLRSGATLDRTRVLSISLPSS